MYGIYGYGASLAAVPRDGGTGSSPEARKKGARSAKPPRGAAQEGPALHARMTLDISALNKQYGRLLQQHKQATIINHHQLYDDDFFTMYDDSFLVTLASLFLLLLMSLFY